MSQAKPAPKQLNLKGWAMQADLKSGGCPTKAEPIFESRAVYMPAYRTHVILNLFLGLPLSLAALKCTVLSTPTDVLAFGSAFIYGTFFLHPDVDLARNIRLFSLKGLLTLPFRPYSYLFRHRGISHTLIIGTLSRVLWLMGLLWLLFSCLDWAYPNIHWNQPTIWFGISGLSLADCFHVFLDRFK